VTADAAALRPGNRGEITASARAPGDLEIPRPLRLLLTAGWNLTESIGLPAAAYAAAAWLYSRDAGLVAGLAAIWLTVLIRKVATGSVPSLLTISAVVLTLQAAVVLASGELWLFLLQFPLANLAMCVLFARTANGPGPLIARLAAEVVALRQPAARHPGLHHFFQRATWLWAGIFLLLTAGLALMMVTEPASVFLMLSTTATIALVAAGAGASAVWFLWVLRTNGLRLRFALRSETAAFLGLDVAGPGMSWETRLAEGHADDSMPGLAAEPRPGAFLVHDDSAKHSTGIRRVGARGAVGRAGGCSGVAKVMDDLAE
jgi:hypothetical protein